MTRRTFRVLFFKTSMSSFSRHFHQNLATGDFSGKQFPFSGMSLSVRRVLSLPDHWRWCIHVKPGLRPGLGSFQARKPNTTGGGVGEWIVKFHFLWLGLCPASSEGRHNALSATEPLMRYGSTLQSGFIEIAKVFIMNLVSKGIHGHPSLGPPNVGRERLRKAKQKLQFKTFFQGDQNSHFFLFPHPRKPASS